MTRAPERGRSRLLVLIGVAVVLIVVVRGFVLQTFAVTSGSMEPTVLVGDRVIADKTVSLSRLHRGDVIVFDATAAFGVAPTSGSGVLGRLAGGVSGLIGADFGAEDYVKRVIGLPGDRVQCCDAQGLVEVNDRAVQEPYVDEGDVPSEIEFDVIVPSGRVWVLGDHRSASSDSRAHLGSPGGGMVAEGDIVGRVSFTYWPLDRLGGVADAKGLSSVPREDNR